MRELRVEQFALVVGIYFGMGSIVLAQSTGACCLNGGCQILSEGTCDIRGGAYVGPLTCSQVGNNCRLVRCCFADAVCSVVSVYECLDVLDGLSYSNGTDCPPGACPATGACCLYPSSTICRIHSETGCTLADRGEYQGDGTTCEETCDRPQACCFRDVTCEDVFDDDCWRDGGRPAGRGTECLTHRCPEPGDIDEDLDRDLDDYRSILECFYGPDMYVECNTQDIDQDGDVDLRDFARFWADFTGDE